jgi:hypothetical protein
VATAEHASPFSAKPMTCLDLCRFANTLVV